MRLCWFVSFGLLLAGCATTPPPAPPALGRCHAVWQQGFEEGVYSAQARAETMEAALRLALADIAGQRQIAIRSEAESLSRKDGNVSVQSFNRRITSVSEFVFDDYTIVCQDFVSNDILVSFDDRPLAERIHSRLQQTYGSDGWQLTGDPVFMEAPLFKDKRLLQSSGINPAILASGIARHSGGWALSLGKHRFKLRDEEWRLLFNLPHSVYGQLSLKLVDEFSRTLQQALFHEQEFRFLLTGKLPVEYYLSLFYITPEGKLVAIRSNEFHNGYNDLTIPQQGIFTAELPAGFESVIDDYVLIVSGEPLQPPHSTWLFNGWPLLFASHPSLGLRLTVR